MAAVSRVPAHVNAGAPFLVAARTHIRADESEVFTMALTRKSRAWRGAGRMLAVAGALAVCGALTAPVPARADSDLIFKKSTVWKFMRPDDKLAVYGIEDPLVNGVACYFTVPERGGVSGMFGVAEETSEISLSCQQVGPISFKGKFEQGDVVFRESRSIMFKKMQIVRGCDAKRNMLVYLVYTDKLIDGSPENSTSSVPIMPWGAEPPVKCSEWITQ